VFRTGHVAPDLAAARQLSSPGKEVGAVIVAHGGGPAWDGQVEAVAREVRLNGPVRVSFLMGPGAPGTPLPDVVRKGEGKGAREIAVVPMPAPDSRSWWSPEW
jgi:hypothetical protein